MRELQVPQSHCRIGIAQCDITPPVGIYHRMWGAASHDRSTGVHRPLTATALALEAIEAPIKGPPQAVIVSIDHCLLWDQELAKLRRTVCEENDLPGEQLIVTFSHTHGAGLIGMERAELPGGDLIPPYLEELASRIATIVRQARSSRTSGTIVYGTGTCSLARQRDFWDEDSKQWVCGFNPDGTSDQTVLVARLSDDAGSVLGTIVNYACHPTTLAWLNTKISPDYVGAMRELVEKATNSPCLFLQGASGDLGPKQGYVGDTAVADRNGRQLGYAVLSVLESLGPAGTKFCYQGAVVSGATLGAWDYEPLTAPEQESARRWRLTGWTLPLEYRSGLADRATVELKRQEWLSKEQAARSSGEVTTAADCRAMAERLTRQLVRLNVLPAGKTFPFPINMLQLGDAFWVFVEGEFYQYFQRTLRDRFPDVAIVVTELANGTRCSYLPTAKTYDTGIYQETVALLAPGSLERVTEEVGAVLADWRTQT